MSFDKFTVIRGFMDPAVMQLFYQYCAFKVARTDYMKQHFPDDYREAWDGKFGDKLIPDSYNHYGDPLFESLLIGSLSPLEMITGMQLVPTYSYWRFYQKGDELRKHVDRDSCEISVTLCVGYSGATWPIWVESGDIAGAIDLEPGDMLVYKGCEVPHWREPYEGFNHAQVFMHYNRADKPDNNLLDGRTMPAIPKF